MKKYQKEHYLENREELLIKVKDYNDKNKEGIAEYKKEWSIKNKEKLLKQRKERYENNKEELLGKNKKYRDNNKEKINAFLKIKRKTNINFKLSGNLRSRINKALKGNTKSLRTMFLIGCSIDYLMYHIQEQFTKGMSWDNYGDWHVDHIKPCDKFNLSKKSEQLKCFNYTNLQPLWAIDNLRKGIKYE